MVGTREGRSWLCPTELDRVRVVEANEPVRRARTLVAVAVGLALAASAPWLGWWTLILFGLAVANLAMLDWRLRRADRPERVAAQSLLFNLCLFAVGVAFTGGPQSDILAWLVIPGAMAAARFRGHVVAAFAALTALVTVGVTVGVDPAAAADEPVPILVTLSLIAAVTAVVHTLMNAEVEQRGAAVLDPLTGLLNRQALQSRVAELEQQAGLTGGSVCFVACDLDGFKRVNDESGHDRGDAVLCEVAYQLRKSLRSFELVYRLGGEEFLVVLPGAGLEEGLVVGERLRAVVADARPGGVRVTMSVGVAAATGADVRYESLFKAADEALYRAKREGRNRVVTDGPPVKRREIDASTVAALAS
jgi:diguanylate cyclase (GGDEF)-like protein